VEGVGFSLYECIFREEKLGVRANVYKIIGGGSKSKLWSQIICDIVGKKLAVPFEDDSSFGTALLAAVTIGFFSDLDDSVKNCVKIKEILQPNEKNHETYKELFKFFCETQTSLSEVYRSYHGFSHGG
jgi:xylulokinase